MHRQRGRCSDPAETGLALSNGVWIQAAAFNDDEEIDNQ